MNRGVVYAQPGSRPTVEEIELDPPGPREVQVRVLANGLCHTDVHVVETNGWGMRFPILLGHEGAGVVEEIGSDVTSVKPGDRVVIAWRAPCGECPSCRLKRTLGTRRPTVHVPFGVMRVQAALTERLPGAPVTRDQLTMLALGDNVVSDSSAVETFKLPLVPLDEQLRRAL